MQEGGERVKPKAFLRQENPSETVAALVLGARRRRGVKSKAFLRQENPSETVVALVREGGEPDLMPSGKSPASDRAVCQ